MAQAKKIYAGSGKKKSDTWFSISINMDKIQDYIQEYNGTKFVKLNVNVNAKPDQYGKDCQVTVDTYTPQNNGRQSGTNQTSFVKSSTNSRGQVDNYGSNKNIEDSDSLPF